MLVLEPIVYYFNWKYNKNKCNSYEWIYEQESFTDISLTKVIYKICLYVDKAIYIPTD